MQMDVVGVCAPLTVPDVLKIHSKHKFVDNINIKKKKKKKYNIFITNNFFWLNLKYILFKP